MCDRRLTQDQVDALAQYTNTYIARVSPAYAPEIVHDAVILAEHTRAWRTAHTREQYPTHPRQLAQKGGDYLVQVLD